MIPFHPFADIFDLLDKLALSELTEDIRRNGLRERIRVLDGQILDGRNRYLASIAAGLISRDDEPEDRPAVFERHVPSVDGEPLGWVISKNVHRRHLTVSQRAYAMAECERLRHGGARQTKAEQDANLRLEAPTETRVELAERRQVSERSINSAAVVRDRGVDELKAAVRHGDVAVSRAEQIARMPEPEQAREVARIKGDRAIMASRQEPDDSLDYFPTPPWATRAVVETVLGRLGHSASFHAQSAWEPACGEGHMAEVLREYFGDVVATDIHDYGYGDRVSDFLARDADNVEADWIFCNPPFGDKAEAFVLKALERARIGVAMFLRLQWLETIGRYERVFQPHPPAVIAQFAERVPVHKGRWEPDGDTATAYLWIVWLKQASGPRRTEFYWIPPGQRDALTYEGDIERFTANPVIKAERVKCDEPFDPVTGEITEIEADRGAGASVSSSGETDDNGRQPTTGDAMPFAGAASAHAGCVGATASNDDGIRVDPSRRRLG